MDAVFRTRLAGTEAEKWWKYEMSWDELLPEIMLTEAEHSDEGIYSDDTDDLPPSVSRRPSNANILAVHKKPVRRDSFQSFATYGSAWTRSRTSSIGSQASASQSPPEVQQPQEEEQQQQPKPKDLWLAVQRLSIKGKKQRGSKKDNNRRHG